MRLLRELTPGAIKSGNLESYFGRRVAIDASMVLYQFLIAVRHGPTSQSLVSESGEVTSHLIGFFYRTIRLLEAGIKPVFVFDGAPPVLKRDELKKRRLKKDAAEREMSEVTNKIEEDDQDPEKSQEKLNQLSKRSLHVTKQHNDDVKKLLRMMGVPVVEAPEEAEAQCADMCQRGLVYATASEDMDVLAFGSPIMVRHFTMPESAKKPVEEIRLDLVLSTLGFTMPQFIDLCILAGCDYTPTIRGIAIKRAYELIAEHKSLKTVLENLDTTKYTIPTPYAHDDASQQFQHPRVNSSLSASDLKMGAIDSAAILAFLGDEKQFQKERILKALDRLQKTKSVGGQMRMDCFAPRQQQQTAVKNTTQTKRKHATGQDTKANKKRQKR